MKKRNTAEEMFNDIMDTVKEKQKDIEKTVNEYTSNISLKPSIDVVEDEDEITVITDLPGVKKENIKIDITEDKVVISVQFDDETEYEDKTFIKKERKYGKAKRRILLPEKVQINESSAKFENGVLSIILPKLEKNQSFEVKVD